MDKEIIVNALEEYNKADSTIDIACSADTLADVLEQSLKEQDILEKAYLEVQEIEFESEYMTIEELENSMAIILDKADNAKNLMGELVDIDSITDR